MAPQPLHALGEICLSAHVCCARRGQRLRGSPARVEPAVPGYACLPTKASTTSGRPCWRAAYCLNHLPNPACTWPRGVTVSTLDSESSDRGSNPREAFRQCACKMSWQSSLRKVESGLKNILAKLVFASGSLKASSRKGAIALSVMLSCGALFAN